MGESEVTGSNPAAKKPRDFKARRSKSDFGLGLGKMWFKVKAKLKIFLRPHKKTKKLVEIFCCLFFRSLFISITLSPSDKAREGGRGGEKEWPSMATEGRGTKGKKAAAAAALTLTGKQFNEDSSRRFWELAWNLWRTFRELFFVPSAP